MPGEQMTGTPSGMALLASAWALKLENPGGVLEVLTALWSHVHFRPGCEVA